MRWNIEYLSLSHTHKHTLCYISVCCVLVWCVSSVLCVIALCVSVLCVSLYVYFIAFIATCVSVCYAVAYRVSAHYGFVCYISVTHKCVTGLSTVCVSIHAFEYITASPPCVRSHANHLLMFPSYSVCVCVFTSLRAAFTQCQFPSLCYRDICPLGYQRGAHRPVQRHHPVRE